MTRSRTKHALLATTLLPCLSLSAFGQCETLKTVASDPDISDAFGAWVTLDGDHLVVGAKNNDDIGNISGKVYFLERGLTGFAETQFVYGSDTAAGDQFGDSLAVSGDVVVVGAEGHDAGAMIDTGAAYVFEKSGGVWTEVAKLQGNDTLAGDKFGDLVDMDNGTIVVGAALNDNPVFGAGAVYVFEKQGGIWSELQKLQASDAGSADLLGNAVAVHGDWIIASAETDDDVGNNAGAVYFFERVGGTFVEKNKLTASDGVADDFLGDEVAIHNNYAIAGTRRKNAQAGGAYIYEHNGTDWVEVAVLEAPDGEPGDELGHAVAINDRWAVVGAYFDDNQVVLGGAAYVWERTNNGWEYVTKLVPNSVQAADVFGRTMSLNGNEVAIGSPLSDAGAPDGGAAYVFDLDLAVGTTYCSATPNSTGLDATLDASGSSDPGENCLLFEARQLPTGVFGYFLLGTGTSFVPLFGGSSGNLCLGGSIFRFNFAPEVILNSGSGGYMRFRPDFNNLPFDGTGTPIVFQSGQSWHFQLWYRDNGTSNTTPGMTINFL